jgi:hypothetical protein
MHKHIAPLQGNGGRDIVTSAREIPLSKNRVSRVIMGQSPEILLVLLVRNGP